MVPCQGRHPSLALDSFMALHPQDELLVSWDVDLDEPATEALEALLNELTSLGRAESTVCARRLDRGSDAVPEGLEPPHPSRMATSRSSPRDCSPRSCRCTSRP